MSDFEDKVQDALANPQNQVEAKWGCCDVLVLKLEKKPWIFVKDR